MLTLVTCPVCRKRVQLLTDPKEDEKQLLMPGEYYAPHTDFRRQRCSWSFMTYNEKDSDPAEWEKLT